MKKWYTSRTLWINVIALTAMVVQIIGWPELAKEIVAIEGSVLAIINLVLRIITNQGLER